MSPTIVTSDSDEVSVTYGPYDTRDDIQRLADSMCKAHGKLARLVADNAKADEPLFRTANFECVQTSLVES